MISELMLKNRSCRRFQQTELVSMETLKELVNLARLSPSAANLQPLKYILSNSPGLNNIIFSKLTWAGYLSDWPGPGDGERPPAYIIILGDNEISNNITCDQGIAAQSILLGAVEKGLAGCIIASVKRDELRSELNLSQRFQILLVLAIGQPKEKILIEDLPDDGSIEYWRDDEGVHHVPKRALDDIILSL